MAQLPPPYSADDIIFLAHIGERQLASSADTVAHPDLLEVAEHDGTSDEMLVRHVRTLESGRLLEVKRTAGGTELGSIYFVKLTRAGWRRYLENMPGLQENWEACLNAAVASIPQHHTQDMGILASTAGVPLSYAEPHFQTLRAQGHITIKSGSYVGDVSDQLRAATATGEGESS